MAEPPDETSQFLLPCSVCSRTFRPEILPRHEKVCEKSTTKKRRIFDSFKSRVQGTELEEFLGPAPLPGQHVRATPKPTKLPQKTPNFNAPKWKETHLALIATVRAARTTEPPSTPAPNIFSAGEQCPTCGRHFGPRAFDRHVEFCREVASRKPKTPQKQSLAQERLEARTKYRAPLSRGKVTPIKPSSASQPSFHNLPASTLPSATTRSVSSATTPVTTRKFSAPASVQTPKVSATASGTFSRQGSIRGSLRQRSVSTPKPPASSGLKRSPSPVKQANNIQQPKQKPYLKETGDLRPRTSKKQVDTTYSELPGLGAIEEAANKQLRALLSWSSSSDLSIQTKPVHPRSTPPQNNFTLPTVRTSPSNNKHTSSPLFASPTSAFSPVTSSKDNGNTTWDNENGYTDINKNDIPAIQNSWDMGDLSDYMENKLIGSSTPKSVRREVMQSGRSSRVSGVEPNINYADEEQNRRNSTISLSSQVSDGTIADEGVLWKTFELLQFPAPLRKSRKKSFARSKSVFEDRNRMLFAQTYDHGSSSEEELGLKADGEAIILRRNSRPAHSHRSHSPLDDEESRQDTVKDTTTMGGGDSAYSSLTRRSPRAQSRMEPERKLSKFCHECGSKYPVLVAKFCCECGVRRLLV